MDEPVHVLDVIGSISDFKPSDEGRNVDSSGAKRKDQLMGRFCAVSNGGLSVGFLGVCIMMSFSWS
jgi:hypothetical protein